MFCETHLHDHDFTLFSTRHLSHSRIVLILVSERLELDVGNALIGSQIMLDPAPVSVYWQLGVTSARTSGWHGNHFLLEAADVEEKVQQEIIDFYIYIYILL